ncbi:hypothetical protein Tco_1108232 [Tanacetum coccineum]
MMTYLKNMGGYKHSQLKAKNFCRIYVFVESPKRVIDASKAYGFSDAVKDSKEAAVYISKKVLEETNSTRLNLSKKDMRVVSEKTRRRLKMKLTKNKELASPKQTALGKYISNSLIVDSLLKTIWLSMHHVIATLAIPEQTTTGKEISNPFIAVIVSLVLSLDLSRLAITLNRLERSINDEVLKLKNFKKDEYASFQDKERYDHAHYETPIKMWSSDMLKKKEVDVFPKDDSGDTDVGEEAEVEVSDEERVLKEDDMFKDYCSVGVLTDLEATPGQNDLARHLHNHLDIKFVMS